VSLALPTDTRYALIICLVAGVQLMIPINCSYFDASISALSFASYYFVAASLSVLSFASFANKMSKSLFSSMYF
jgi:hypothetical protein